MWCMWARSAHKQLILFIEPQCTRYAPHHTLPWTQVPYASCHPTAAYPLFCAPVCVSHPKFLGSASVVTRSDARSSLPPSTLLLNYLIKYYPKFIRQKLNVHFKLNVMFASCRPRPVHASVRAFCIMMAVNRRTSAPLKWMAAMWCAGMFWSWKTNRIAHPHGPPHSTVLTKDANSTTATLEPAQNAWSQQSFAAICCEAIANSLAFYEYMTANVIIIIQRVDIKEMVMATIFTMCSNQ